MSKWLISFLAVLLVCVCLTVSAYWVSADSGGTVPLVPALPFSVELIGDEDAVIACPTSYNSLGGIQYYHVTYGEFDVGVGLEFATQPNIPYVSGQYLLRLIPSNSLNLTDVRIYCDSVPFFLFPSWENVLSIETRDDFVGFITMRGLDGEERTWNFSSGGGAFSQQTSLLAGIFDEAIAQFGVDAPVWLSFDVSCETGTVPNVLYYGGVPSILTEQILGAFDNAVIDEYNTGYSHGFSDGSAGDWFGGLGNSVGSFLETELLPGFSFANVLFVVVGLGILAFVLKLFFL